MERLTTQQSIKLDSEPNEAYNNFRPKNKTGLPRQTESRTERISKFVGVMREAATIISGHMI